jgi:signal transduction histidine kinase
MNMVALTVQDTGMGISEADLPFVFDRFFRGKDVMHSVHGTGIGLSIVKCIVQQHGGEVKIFSSQAQGTRTEILLPAAL